MILGTLVTNIRNNQILARMKDPVYTEKIEFFLLEFMNSATKKSGLVYKDLYKYIYTFDEDNYYVLITSLLFNEIKGFSILTHLINSKGGDPLDLLIFIDNIIYEDNIVYPDLNLIFNMDSQEEKIYKMMMKNKELEMRRKQKEIIKNKSKGGNGSKLDLNKLNINSKLSINNDLTSKPTINNTYIRNDLPVDFKPKDKKRRFETSTSPIFICFKEKIKCVINQENKIKLMEVMGEMTLNIKEEDFNNLEIKLKGNYEDCKFSPKLNKKDTNCGIIKSEKGFSLNKNIALLKWRGCVDGGKGDGSKVEKGGSSKVNANGKPSLSNPHSNSNPYLSNTPPLEFTIWPSEIKLNTFQFTLEIIPNLDLENLLISIPKRKLREIKFENENEDNLEWKIDSISKGDSDSLEFQCKCEDPSDIFPIEIYFTSPGCYREIGIASIKMNGEDLKEKTDIKKMREVDEFTLESE
ncbi:coatomer complex delta subunit [Nosema bombycis CQ1]|uniref:Coatomer subunit delta n=1 Tax=Nosema bombycis (strain CQ1 / CVCC 102059) TaxID=578461 RepID=R0M0G6_NOSB1|nr:coatomer complex delta subunit [Nosema bombycis CQ1]|eukprot:EOB11514.1 coatomer complex delta subunit [Nosema bombycis CQ1]